MTSRSWKGRRRPSPLVVGTVSALALLASGCTGSSTDAPPAPAAAETIRPGGTAVFATDAAPITSFNNRTATGNSTAVRNVMRRVWPSVWITTPDFQTIPDGNFVTVEGPTIEKPTTIVYKINPNAVWSDRQPISAADFVYNWEVEKPGALDIDGKPISWVAPGEETIQSVTGSPDGKTVTVVLKEPFAEWRSIFAKPLVPAHIGRRVGWNQGFSGFNPDIVISGGPYRIESHTGQDLKLVRNDSFSQWGTPANLDSVIFRFGASASAALDALRNGEVDVIAPRSQVDILGRLREVDGVTTLVGTGFEAENLDLNLSNPLLGLPEVRQAFALALDRQAIVNRTAGQIDKNAKVMQHRLLPAGDPNYPKQTTGASRYSKADVAAARALLEGAGFRPDPDGIYAKDGKRLSLRITSTTGDALRENQTELIQSQVKLAGIDIVADNIAPSALNARIAQGDFDIISLLQGMPAYPTTTSASFGKGGNVNISKYDSEPVNDLYAAAKSQLDEKKRAELLNQIDEQLWKDLPRIPLYQRPAIVSFRTTLANVGMNPVSGPVWNIEQWGMKALPKS